MVINGKIAFVTGGMSGIGLAVVYELLRNGAKNVVLVDINANSVILEQLEREFGSKVLFLNENVGNRKALEDALTKAVDIFQNIDIIFNNAGVLNEVEWEQILDVNLKAVVAGTHFAYKHMGKHNGGKGGIVINTSSVAFLKGSGGIPVYTASKFGVVGLGQAFGHQFHYERSGVKILTVCPSHTLTGIAKNLKTFDEAMGKFHDNEVANSPPQSSEEVAKHIINIIKNGDHGTTWLIEENKAFSIKIPAKDEYEKTELPL